MTDEKNAQSDVPKARGGMTPGMKYLRGLARKLDEIQANLRRRGEHYRPDPDSGSYEMHT